MIEMLETAELLAFTRTVEAQSLSRAAVELGLPRATVSRRLQRMERRLGVRLIRRTTRSLALTDAGAALYQRARQILLSVRDAEASVRHSDDVVRGSLRVSAPAGLPTSFPRMLCDFAERYPEVRLEMNLTSRHVDMQAEGYDVALRASTSLAPGLVGRTLARERILAVASPAYLATRGKPRSVRALKGHACIMGYVRGEHPQTTWPLLRGGAVQVEGRLFTNDLELLLLAALRGRGIALLPSLLVNGAITAGKLLPVLERIVGATSSLAVVYLERELMPPAVRAFVDAVVHWSKSDLDCKEAARSAERRIQSS